MDKSDIPFLTASDLSRLIEKREVSPVEATEAYQERIERLDPSFTHTLLCAPTKLSRLPGRRSGLWPRATTLGPCMESPWR